MCVFTLNYVLLEKHAMHLQLLLGKVLELCNSIVRYWKQKKTKKLGTSLLENHEIWIYENKYPI